MSLNFLKKAASDAGKHIPEPEEAPKKSGLAGLKGLKGTTAHTQSKKVEEDEAPAKSSGGGSAAGLGFLKKGKEAKQALAEEQAKQDAKKEKAGKMFDFRMKEGEERRITFLDGSLDGDGILDITMYHEHNLPMAGGYEQFVCTEGVDPSQPCPLCSANNKRYLVGLMTVIDHTPYKIKNGPKAGQTVVNQRKIFKCKQTTIKILTKIASKKGGLEGWTFDVTRSAGDKVAAVGDVFLPDVKWESRGKFAGAEGLKLEDVQPANYQEEIIYKSPEQLEELGIGKSFTGVGTKKGGSVDTGSLKGQL